MMKARTRTGLARILTVTIACLFAQYTLAPRPVAAWGFRTHRELVDWAYQIIKLTEYELTTNPRTGVYLSRVQGSMIAPPAGCTGQCLAEWSNFLLRISTARSQLAQMTFGPASKDPEQHSGNTTCSPTNTGVAAGDYDRFLKGRAPGCSSDVDTEYEAGGLFDDPAIRDNHKLLGNTLGAVALAADVRTEDWDPDVSTVNFFVSGLSWLLTQDTNNLDWIADGIEAAREIGRTSLGTLIGVLILLLTLGQVDEEDAIRAGMDIADFVFEFDSGLYAGYDDILSGIPELGGEDKYIGLGHFINVQPQVNASFGTWPSNDYDDHQGLFYDEAYYNVSTAPGAAQLFQDPFDHFLIDFSGLGATIDSDSFGVQHYQVGSKERGFFTDGDWSSEDSYWESTEIHAIAFTPLEKLGFHGWAAFMNDPCKTADKLMWPLHALGDASVPMHVIGATGQGHRPFESSVNNAAHWETVRHLSDTEFAKPDDIGEYASTAQQDAAFQAQYDQARSILLRAFEWSRLIQQRQAATGDPMPIQELVTKVAQQTLDTLHNSAANLRCDRDACVRVSRAINGCDPRATPTSCRVEEIHCDGSCVGFLNDPLRPGVPLNPTANHLHCWAAAPQVSALTKCPVEARVALALSSPPYAGVSYPAILAPALSDDWYSSHDYAEPFYAAYVDDYRRFSEIGVAATLAFLVHAAGQVGSPNPNQCYCAPGLQYCSAAGTPSECVDIANDRNNCGACGNVCSAAERCVGGQCSTPCAAPWQVCGGVCIDPRSDEQNCGGCGLTCQAGEFCDFTCVKLL